MDLGDSCDHISRAAGIADSPAGHGESFGEAVQYQGAFFHAWQSCEGIMFFAAVYQFAVDLIADHEQVMFFHDLSNWFIVFFAHDTAGWVVWIWQQQHFGVWCDFLFQFFCG